jgi:apolipoprotein N-acyltransferase
MAPFCRRPHRRRASALAFAPFHAFPVLWLTVPVFVWLIDGRRGRRGRRLGTGACCRPAVVGFRLRFRLFLAGLWWIGAAFLVDGDRFAWLMPFAVSRFRPARAVLGLRRGPRPRFLADGWPRMFVFAVALRSPSGCAGTSSPASRGMPSATR